MNSLDRIEGICLVLRDSRRMLGFRDRAFWFGLSTLSVGSFGQGYERPGRSKSNWQMGFCDAGNMGGQMR